MGKLEQKEIISEENRKPIPAINIVRLLPNIFENKKVMGKPKSWPKLYNVTIQLISSRVTENAAAMSCCARIIERGKVLLMMAPKAAILIIQTR